MNSPHMVVRARRLPFSFRLDRRVPVVLAAFALLTLASMVASIGVGEFQVGPQDVARTVLGLGTADPTHEFIVNTLRLPRVLVAFLAGAGLALSGAIMQALTRNPLAAPEITGVTAGAGLAAVLLLVLMPTVSVTMLPLAALVGAAVVSALVYSLAWGKSDSPIRLILIGIGVTSVIGALTTMLLTFGQIENVARALVWLTGSVYGRGWDDVKALLPWLAILGPATLLMAPQLNTLQLGEDVARSLGSRVARDRGLLILMAAGLAAAVVSVAGTIGFVGLMAPHIARRLVGPAHQGLLAVAAMTGGLMVVLADLVGRTLFAPIELPCGIVTAAIGAPFFLYLLTRTRST